MATDYSSAPEDPQAAYLQDRYAKEIERLVNEYTNSTAQKAITGFLDDVVQYWSKQIELYSLLSNMNDESSINHQCVFHKIGPCAFVVIQSLIMHGKHYDFFAKSISWDCSRCSLCILSYQNYKIKVLQSIQTSPQFKDKIKSFAADLSKFDLSRFSASAKLIISALPSISSKMASILILDLLHEPLAFRTKEIIDFVDIVLFMMIKNEMDISVPNVMLPGLLILAIQKNDSVRKWAYDRLKSFCLTNEVSSRNLMSPPFQISISTIILLLQFVAGKSELNTLYFHGYDVTLDKGEVWKVFRLLFDIFEKNNDLKILLELENRFNVQFLILSIKQMSDAKCIEDYQNGLNCFTKITKFDQSKFFNLTNNPKKQQECFDVICKSSYFIESIKGNDTPFSWILPSSVTITYPPYWGNVCVVSLIKHSLYWPDEIRLKVDKTLYQLFIHSCDLMEHKSTEYFLSTLILSKLGVFVLHKYVFNQVLAKRLFNLLKLDIDNSLNMGVSSDTYNVTIHNDVWASLDIIRFENTSIVSYGDQISLLSWFVNSLWSQIVKISPESINPEKDKLKKYITLSNLIVDSGMKLLFKNNESFELVPSYLCGLSMVKNVKNKCFEVLCKLTSESTEISCINSVIVKNTQQSLSVLTDIATCAFEIDGYYPHLTKRMIELVSFFDLVTSTNARNLTIIMCTCELISSVLALSVKWMKFNSVSKECLESSITLACGTGYKSLLFLLNMPPQLIEHHKSALQTLTTVEELDPYLNSICGPLITKFAKILYKLDLVCNLKLKFSNQFKLKILETSIPDKRPLDIIESKVDNVRKITRIEETKEDTREFDIWKQQAKNAMNGSTGFKLSTKKGSTSASQAFLQKLGPSADISTLKPVSRKPIINPNVIPQIDKSNLMNMTSNPYGRGADSGITIVEDEDGSRTRKKMDDRSVDEKKPERTTMKLDLGLETKTIIKASQTKNIKEMLHAPNNFFVTVLGWSPNYKGNLANKNAKFKDIPSSFDSTKNYINTFLPFLIQETYDQVQNSLSYVVEDDTFDLHVNAVTQVDDFRLIKCATNDRSISTKISELDLVILEQNGNSIYGKINAIIPKGKDVYFDIMVSWTGNARRMAANGSSIRCTRVMSLVTNYREYIALVSLDFIPFKRDIINCSGVHVASPTKPEIERIKNRYLVNESQASVILSTLQMKNGFSLIQGPPGTGKTRTIVTLIGALLSFMGNTVIKIPTQSKANIAKHSPHKILCCAPSNAAVDEIALRLKNGVPDGKGSSFVPSFVRIGQLESMHPNIRDYSLDSLADNEYKAKKGKSTSKTPIDDINLDKLHIEIRALEASRNEAKEKERAAEDGDIEEIKELISNLSSKLSQLRTLFHDKKQQIREESITNDRLRKQLRKDIVLNSSIVLTTLSGAGHEMFSDVAPSHFDTIIIDETCQAVELSTLIPLKFASKKCVLVGDPKQLPPTVISRIASKYNYDRSLFQRLMKGRPDSVHILQTQYRMNPEISKFASVEFYDSKLLDAPEISKRKGNEWDSSSLFPHMSFVDVAHGVQKKSGGHMQSFFNMAEAQYCLYLVESLCNMYKSVNFVNKIGIISFYKHQVRVIKDLLVRRFNSKDILNSISVNTVDGFQGQEKEIIILSCVRTNNIGFTSDIRRINVALTRARSTVVVLGYQQNLEIDKTWKSLINYCKSINRFKTIDYVDRITTEPPYYMLIKSTETFIYPEDDIKEKE